MAFVGVGGCERRGGGGGQAATIHQVFLH
jgi:hypothetical protein